MTSAHAYAKAIKNQFKIGELIGLKITDLNLLEEVINIQEMIISKINNFCQEARE